MNKVVQAPGQELVPVKPKPAKKDNIRVAIRIRPPILAEVHQERVTMEVSEVRILPSWSQDKKHLRVLGNFNVIEGQFEKVFQDESQAEVFAFVQGKPLPV